MQDRVASPPLIAPDHGTDPREMNAPEVLERQHAQVQRLADAVLKREGVRDSDLRDLLASMGYPVDEDGD